MEGASRGKSSSAAGGVPFPWGGRVNGLNSSGCLRRGGEDGRAVGACVVGGFAQLCVHTIDTTLCACGALGELHLSRAGQEAMGTC